VAVGVGKIGDALVRELAKDAADLKVGPGTDPKTTLGPVIRGERKKKLIEYIDGAKSEGAQVVSDGRQVDRDEGFFLGPTILDKVTPRMTVWKDELFGPVLAVMRAGDIDEALNVLNSSTYGNMASIFTGSGKNAREFKRRAQAGMLGVNIGVAAPMAFFPFTGWKNSFFGDLHATGQDSIRFYTRHKVVTTRWL
jgi:malonate-semialdehyde dehydrogenase (acetylating)/methylmalonate-semialdehyde dehydrogenase